MPRLQPPPPPVVPIKQALEDAHAAALAALDGASPEYVFACLRAILRGLPPLNFIPEHDRRRVLAALAAARRCLRPGTPERLRQVARGLGCQRAQALVPAPEAEGWEIAILALVLTLAVSQAVAAGSLAASLTLSYAAVDVLPHLGGEATITTLRERLSQLLRRLHPTLTGNDLPPSLAGLGSGGGGGAPPPPPLPAPAPAPQGNGGNNGGAPAVAASPVDPSDADLLGDLADRPVVKP